MTIRRKLVAIIMIISSAAVLMAGATSVVYQYLSFRRQMVNEFSTHVRMIADNCHAALAFDAPGDAKNILNSLKAKSSVAYACIYGEDGAVFAEHRRSDFTGEPQWKPGPEHYRFSGDWLVATHPIVMDNEVLGSVFIQSDLTEARASLQKSILVIAVIVLVVLMIAFAMSSGLQRVISAPVQHLAEIAAAVTENKDYSVRAERRGRDEFGVLTASFNNMLEKMERRERELRKSEGRYRGVFENTGAATCIIDRECVITMCNSMFEKLCGFSRDEIENVMFWHDLVTQDERMRLGDYSRQRMERTGAPPDEYECDFVDRIGRRKQIHVMIAFIPDGDNRVVSVLDITERVRGGEELKRHRDHLGEMVRERTSELAKINKELQREIADHKRTETALARSEEMFSKAFHSVGAFMAVTTLYGGRFLEVNKRFLDTLGYEREEVIGKTSREIELFTDYGQREHLMELARKKGRIRNENIMIRSKSGEIRHGSISADVILVEDQECLLTVMMDVTEYKLAMDAMKKTTLAAETAGRAKSEILAGMSHEVTASLNEITGFSELLSTLVTDERPRGYIDAIRRMSESLLARLGDILDLSRIEVGMIKIKREEVNPVMIFNEIEQRFAGSIAEKGLEFDIDLDEELPPLLFLDETRLKQVLGYLVGAAVACADRGAVALSAGMKPKSEDSSRIDLILTVEDAGAGIPREELETVFESFRGRSVRGPNTYGGPDPGLVIARKLVEMMGGRIAVSSESGVGARFEIVLNDVRAASLKTSSAGEALPDIDAISFENARIMVVDDIKSNRNLLKKMLTDVGLDVLTAENGEEAVLLAREHHPEVIIMDIMMPVMDGVEATRQLKKNPKTKDIRVIALTAAAKLNDAGGIPESGLDGYLLKPIKKRELIGEVARYLSYTVKGG